MSKEPPAGAHLARTLEPQEREQVEALFHRLNLGLRILVGVLLAGVLAAVLAASQFEKLPLGLKLVLSYGVVILGIVVWRTRRRSGQLAEDLAQGAVYSLEGTVERKRVRRQGKNWTPYELRVAGVSFAAEEEQFNAVAQGASCAIEFLPTSRLTLKVNDLKRWP